MSRIDNSPGAVLTQKQNSKSNLAELVFPSSDNSLNMGMVFQFVNFATNFGQGGAPVAKNLTQAHIALPLPENLQDVLNINYETVDLGAVTAGLATGGAIKDAFAKGGMEAVGNVAKDRLPSDAEYLARSLAGIAAPVAGALNLASGNVPNPFTTAVFKNVEIRRHNLNFKLVPQTPQDSVIIKKIINRFKRESLPAGGGQFLKMPREVNIEFCGTDALYGFGRCVIQGITVNYNPSNAPAFYKYTGDGLINAPQSVELQLQLSEVEQLLGSSFDDHGGNAATLSSPLGAESQSLVDRPINGLREGSVNPISRFSRGGG